MHFHLFHNSYIKREKEANIWEWISAEDSLMATLPSSKLHVYKVYIPVCKNCNFFNPGKASEHDKHQNNPISSERKKIE